jgi:hypothetical protein
MEFDKDHKVKDLQRDSIKLGAIPDVIDSIFGCFVCLWFVAVRIAFDPKKQQAGEPKLFTKTNKQLQRTTCPV